MEKKNMVAMSSSSIRIKSKKFKRVTLRNCSNHKLELKVTSAEQVSDDHKTVERTIEVMQSTVNEVTNEDAIPDFPGLPLGLSFNHTMKPKVIFVLENASLVRSSVGKNKKWKILNAEEDEHFLLKQKKNLNDYLPDIVYKAVRKILDAPLNKAGMVGAVYVKIENGLLFEIKPHVRLPRTLDRFCGIMLELLEKSCIRTKDTGEVLIQAIEEPLTRHLPANSRIIGISNTSEKVVDVNDYVASVADDLNLVFVVGASLDGNISKEYLDDSISVSNFPLLPRISLGAICYALQQKWNVV